MTSYSHIRDNDREVVETGDRVKILCGGDPAYYRGIGHVLLIEAQYSHRVFVQMQKYPKNGIWWNPKYIRRHPNILKRFFKVLKRLFVGTRGMV